MDMSKTLSENGIPDEDGELDQCRMDRDLYTPSICLYFNDDLTELWPKGRTGWYCNIINQLLIVNTAFYFNRSVSRRGINLTEMSPSS